MEAERASVGRLSGLAGVAGACALSALVGSALIAATAARATTPTIDYPDFSSVAGLALDGDAAQAGTALRLTPNAALRHGSAWAQTQVVTSQSFESRFEAFSHDGSFSPADGFTFALQSQGLSALGDNGGAHGYGGHSPVSPSLALDVSLFPQILNGGNEQFSIVANGNLQSPLAKATSPALLYGSPFWAWVDYDAKAHSLQVFVSPTATKPATALVSASVDLPGVVGPAAYAGFTAGTGGLDADFDILSWTVAGTDDTTPPVVTCSADPATLWPPNNKLVAVATTVTVSDSGSGPAGFTLVSVTSNEGDVGAESKGWTPGTPDTAGQLQAARLGSGSGRVYTLAYQGRDNAGNTASCSTTVTVPHDQGR